MKLCLPVEKYEGMMSKVYGHFGSAPSFALYDTDSGEVSEIVNKDAGHEHGKCSPLKALDGHAIDCVIVGGIGGGALGKLGSAGIEVYRAEDGTIENNLGLFNEGKLGKFNPTLVCGGLKGGCSHH